MEWLNYHHLLYFWLVAREGGVAAAAARLRLAHPTISGQVRALEGVLGEKLFKKQGRRLVLTEMGQVVYRYADEIFSLGQELVDTVKGRPTGKPLRLTVGIADVLPKLIVRRLLGPAQALPGGVHIICREDKPARLLTGLAAHELDVVLSDAPAGAESNVRAFSHLLGECGITIFAAPALARRYRRGFPASLDNAPFLLPTDNTILRRSLEQWFQGLGVRPVLVAEFEDSALLKAFGQDGAGLFAGPSVIAADLVRQYGIRAVGSVDTVKERFYAITVERRLRHPAVIAISQSARQELFA